MPCQKCNGHYNKETREFRCTHKIKDFIIPRWSTLKGLDFHPEICKFYHNDNGKSSLEQKIREIFVGCVLF